MHKPLSGRFITACGANSVQFSRSRPSAVRLRVLRSKLTAMTRVLLELDLPDSYVARIVSLAYPSATYVAQEVGREGCRKRATNLVCSSWGSRRCQGHEDLGCKRMAALSEFGRMAGALSLVVLLPLRQGCVACVFLLVVRGIGGSRSPASLRACPVEFSAVAKSGT